MMCGAAARQARLPLSVNVAISTKMLAIRLSIREQACVISRNKTRSFNQLRRVPVERQVWHTGCLSSKAKE